jgi:hypothetical protein
MTFLMQFSSHIDQQLADLEQEQALLDQNRHPEQLECLWGIHKYVDGKLRPEEERFKYTLQNKNEVHGAETFIIKAQYRQKVVDFEEKFLGRINDKMNELEKALVQGKEEEEEQKEGKEDKEYGMQNTFCNVDDG